jgi:hypothetical protein
MTHFNSAAGTMTGAFPVCPACAETVAARANDPMNARAFFPLMICLLI